MNYLAHAYLSFGDPALLAGNMIADFVKGRARHDFPAGIRAGIELHRRIDEFTDSHPATRSAKEFFRPHYRLYSAPIVDIVYDHFLANDATAFPDSAALEHFVQDTYRTLSGFAEWFPPRFARMFPYMQEQNWLYQYRHSAGIAQSLGGLARRASWMGEPQVAVALLESHHGELRACYEALAPDVKDFAKMEADALGGYER
ncbi:acyl carrier protein phosphodiesterase [Flaviaesturariibacter terrae]